MAKTHDADGPGRELKRLGILVGRWRTEGRVLGDESTPEAPIIGTDTYRWLGGGYFLIHDVDVVVGAQKVEAIELIGEYDQASGAYVARSFDNRGSVVDMSVRVDDEGVWTFSGGPEVAPAAQSGSNVPTERVRSTLVIGEGGQTMSALWERSPDGNRWLPWMDVRFTRIS